jgi:hypothetical protein
LHELRRSRALGNPDVLRFFCRDPVAILHLLPAAADAVWRKAATSP